MVSLVMPVWNPNPRWLREAVDSALGQRDCSIELLVVDDGNAEPVAGLLSDIDDPRLIVERIPHGGVSRARNAGIARATGEWLRFIDADDVVEPMSTARLVRLSGPDRAIAYGGTLLCDEELRPVRSVEETLQGDVLIDMLLGGFSVYVVSMLFPRDVVSAVGGFDPDFEVNGDFDYILRAVEQAPVRGERAVATLYRRNETSITGGAHAGKKRDMQAFDKVLARRPELRGTRIERVGRAILHMNAARQLLLAGRYPGSARETAAALRLDPRGSARPAAGLAIQAPRVGARRAIARARGRR